MTRGTVLVVTNKGIIESCQKNGDMYLTGLAAGLCEELAEAKTLDEVTQVMREFAKEHFGAGTPEALSNGLMPIANYSSGTFDYEYKYPHDITVRFAPANVYWPLMMPIGSASAYRNLPGYSSDYQIVKNCTGCILHVVDKNGNRVSLLPNDVAMFGFGARLVKFFSEGYKT